MLGYNSKAKEKSLPLKKQICLGEVPAWAGMAISSSLSKTQPFFPTSPRHGHVLQPHQGTVMSSSLTKARTFPPASPRHSHFFQPRQGMAMSSSLTKAQQCPPVSPRHKHFLQAVQTTRAQHSHTQPPPATALQNQMLVAGKLPSDALSLQENISNWQPVN